MIHIAIVEDESIYADSLQEYIQKYAQEQGRQIKVTLHTDGEDIVDNYTGEYDIILMDIQMRFMDGMTAAEKIRKLDEEVVIMFITNMTQYAVRGYQVDAMDYVLKPVEYFAFSQKLDKAISRIRRKSRNFITVPTEDGIQKVDVELIEYVESQGHNVIFRTESEEFVARNTLKILEKTLEPYGFFRCSKGFLVNMKMVDGISGGDCVIKNKKIPIGRTRKKEFMDVLIKYMNGE